MEGKVMLATSIDFFILVSWFDGDVCPFIPCSRRLNISFSKLLNLMVHCCMYAPAKFASFYKSNRKLHREGESVPDVTLIKKFSDCKTRPGSLGIFVSELPLR